MLAGHSLDVTIVGKLTGPGKSANRVTNVVIKDSKGNNVSRFYNITTINGELIVVVAKS